MRIITNLEALDFGQKVVEMFRDKDNPELIAQMLHDAFETLSEAFLEYTTDPETYLYGDVDEKLFMIGAQNPDQLVNAAKLWNQEIREDFVAALKGLGGASIAAENLPIDNDKTYAMTCAARELDNCWWCYATHATYLPNNMGYPYFQCSLDEETLQDIISRPEQYMIVEVFVK